MTEILAANDKAAVDQAVALLRKGDIVAFPTDTIYGIGASITHEAALEKIFTVKKRPANKAIVVFVPDFKSLGNICTALPANAKTIFQPFWPGQLTVIFNKKETLPDWVTAGKPTVALRIPNYSLCLDLTRRLGHPMAVTSANVSSMPTPLTAQGVAKALGGTIPLILDGGPSEHTKPSSLIDYTKKPPSLLREGLLTFSHLCPFIPDLQKMT